MVAALIGVAAGGVVGGAVRDPAPRRDARRSTSRCGRPSSRCRRGLGPAQRALPSDGELAAGSSGAAKNPRCTIVRDACRASRRRRTRAGATRGSRRTRSSSAISAEIDASSPGAPASCMRRPSAVAMSVNARTPSALTSPIVDVALHPRPDHRPVAAVGREEPAEERAQLGVALGVGSDRPERVGQRAHLVRALGRERAEQVFLVREVEVERAVRRARGAHDVVDARGVEAAVGEHAHARVEQSPHRLATLRAQLARLRGRTRHDVARALPAATIAVADDLYASLSVMLPNLPDDRRSRPPLRRSYRLRHASAAGRSLRRLDRISDEVAVGLARDGVRRRRRASRSCCRPGPSTSSPTARRPSSARSPRASTTGLSPNASAPRCSTLARSEARRSTTPPADGARRRARTTCGFAARRRRRSPTTPTAPVAIIFTSGTTGLPKGALYGNRQLAFITQTDVGDTWDGGGRSFTRHVVRAPRLHDEAARATSAAAARRSSWSAGAPPTRSSCSHARSMTTVAGVPTQLALMLRQPDFDRFDLSTRAVHHRRAAARSRPGSPKRRAAASARSSRRATRAPRPASASAPRSTIPTRTRS